MIKKCVWLSAELICQDNRQAFSAISQLRKRFQREPLMLKKQAESGHRWSTSNDRKESLSHKDVESKVTAEYEVGFLQFELHCTSKIFVQLTHECIVMMINFIRANDLNHRKINSLLDEVGSSYGWP
ncbi:hypothetical protein RF11_00554 [Thelohanellus kitauei]|uniref:Uncharacterized protein n=1 Tax=Thelohanellus kitauei TaxID=669202 RepID=A0A0C2ND16_THEKT|nr:hypothetical protein RF11_00554 [Thelohanellus kitauei]